MALDIKAYTKKTRKLNYSAGDIFRKIEQGKDLDRITQSWGLVTSGILKVTQTSGGISWGISEYIEFSYVYTSRPSFTCGLDGTAGIDWSAGDNRYTKDLPSSLSELTNETYQPAIFVPRIIHWHKSNSMFLGCYLLVCQLNSECTETDKVLRLHYRFEGDGYVSS